MSPVMMSDPPKPALRPMLPADPPVLAAIFRAAIETLAEEDYAPGQLAAWADSAGDEAGFARRLTANLTLVATMGGGPVAFASLKGTDTIDMLYVHPAIARQGIGTLLVDALEKLSAARGAKKLAGDISDTALPLFQKRGYQQQRRNSVPLGDVWLGNTTMTKALGAADTLA